MATQLTLYNEVLLTLGARRIGSLTQMSDERIVLDDFYSSVIALCLEEGFWKFAIRSSAITGTGVTNAALVYPYKFTVPTDWVRTFIIAENNQYSPPLLDYIKEGGFWWANVATLYVRYISNDITSYGGNLALWPESFESYVVTALAAACRPRFPESTIPLEQLKKQERAALRDARSKDAMNEPPRFPPTGSWVRARRYGSNNPPDWGGTTLV